MTGSIDNRYGFYNTVLPKNFHGSSDICPMGFIYSIQNCEISHQTFGPSHRKCPTCPMIFVNTAISNFEVYLILWLENILTGPCGQLLWVPGYDDSAHQKFANATTQKRTVMKQRLPKLISSAIIITKCINYCLKYLELGPDRGISIFVDGSKVIVQMSTIHVAWLHSNRKRYDKYSFHLIFTFFCDRHTLVV